MDNNLIIVPSEAQDVYSLMNRLRDEDVAECQAAGLTPSQALVEGFTQSEICYTAKDKGKPIAMFGVCSKGQPKGQGAVWYLGSDESLKYPISLVKKGKHYVEGWLTKYTMLFNVVDARNIRHIEWLKRIGFIFNGSILINNFKFLYFYKTKE